MFDYQLLLTIKVTVYVNNSKVNIENKHIKNDDI